MNPSRRPELREENAGSPPTGKQVLKKERNEEEEGEDRVLVQVSELQKKMKKNVATISIAMNTLETHYVHSINLLTQLVAELKKSKEKFPVLQILKELM